MKIAYLILVHHDIKHLNRLIAALDTENTTFYIHVDRKSSEIQNDIILKNNIIILSTYRIYWGGWNMVQASLQLLKRAYADYHDRYIFISGQDYPIISNNEIVNFLRQEQNHFFYFTDEIEIKKKQFRYQFFYPMDFFKGSTKIVWRFGQLHSFLSKIGLFKVKKLGDSKKIYFGSQWGVLTHTTTNRLLYTIDVCPEILNFFPYSFIPDEMFYQTILLSYLPEENINNHLITFQKWDDELTHPLILTEKEIDVIFKSQKIFMRKCDSLKSTTLLDLIDVQRQ